MRTLTILLLTLFGGLGVDQSAIAQSDPLRQLQAAAALDGTSPVGYWGTDPKNYLQWGTHSNRLVPVYTFGTRGAGQGIELASYQGAASPYRSVERLTEIYGRLPTETLNPEAEYLDQTNLYDLQLAALQAGRKHIMLVVFDGLDWNTTRTAAIFRTQTQAYHQGRGSGLHFLDYTAGGTTEYGFMCTSPHNEGTTVDVNLQTVLSPNGKLFGGYNVQRGGPNPWTPGIDPGYLIASPSEPPLVHAYTDSSSSATSMCAGIKTFNDGVNIDPTGNPVRTIAHLAQQAGYKAGAVSSVPISHATPAASYASNVSRDDYQDLTRDLLGLPSVSRPTPTTPGLDVLIGGGYGDERLLDRSQGTNFVPGNVYLTAADLQQADVAHGGKYVVALRTARQSGGDLLRQQAARARAERQRLLGLFGVGAYKGHLPYATADGDYRPAPGRAKTAEKYTAGDLTENPTLAEMTSAALEVLSAEGTGFWLMVEAGDVDWAHHDNNLDNSIGAILGGDAAVKTITEWVEQHSNWQESVVIVTSDHGHYFHLLRPDLLVSAPVPQTGPAPTSAEPK